MSYTRDHDYLTRGVGAIAATDASVARQRRHTQLVRGTLARDRTMAAVSRGALGVITSGTFTEAGTYAGPQPTDYVYDPPSTPAPVIIMPPTPALVVSPGGATSPVVGTASGGSVGVAMGPPVPAASPLPPIPILDGGSTPAPVAAPNNTMRNVAIAAAAAGAVYFLFFRGRS